MNDHKEFFVLGFILIIFGFLITPFISGSLFGLSITCSHINMYFVGSAVIFIGFVFVNSGWKKN